LFFEVDERKLENVNKGGCRTNKHVELWAKKAFDEWTNFRVMIQKSIVNLFENKKTIEELIDMLVLFVLQITKKDGTMYLLTKVFKKKILLFCLLIFFLIFCFVVWLHPILH